MAVLSALSIYLDIVNNKLVGGLNGQQFVFDLLEYGDVFPVNLYPVIPIANATLGPGVASTVQYNGIQWQAGANVLGMDIAIGPVDGSYAPYFKSLSAGGGDTAAWVWTQDVTQANIGFFSGLMSFNTAGFLAYFTGASKATPLVTNLQFRMSDASAPGGSLPTVYYTGAITVNQPILQPAANPTPAPTQQLLGNQIILTSASGQWRLQLFAQNDGTLGMNATQLF